MDARHFRGAMPFTSGIKLLSSSDHMQNSCSSRWHISCSYRNTLHSNPIQKCYWEQSWLVSIKHSQYWNTKLMHCVLYFSSTVRGKISEKKKKRKMWAIKSASHPRFSRELRTRSHHKPFQDLAANRKSNWTINGYGLSLCSQTSVWYEFGLLP